MAEPDDGLRGRVERLCRQDIVAAGRRYAPGLDANAPNLRANALVSALDSVACGTEVHARFSGFICSLKDTWKRAESSVQAAAEISAQISALAALSESELLRQPLPARQHGRAMAGQRID